MQRRTPERAGLRRGALLTDLIFATFLFGMGVMIWLSVYPTADRSSRTVSSYSQAVSVLQHKADQLRAVGFGRLTFTELRNAGVVDATPNASPYRFDIADNLGALFTVPVGTMTITSPAADLRQVDLLLTWQNSLGRSSSHAITVLIAQE